MRLLVLQNIVNPHLTPVFEALGRLTELTVVYFAASEADRRFQNRPGAGYQEIILQGRKLDVSTRWNTISAHYNRDLPALLRKHTFDVLINAGWASPSNWLGLHQARTLRKPQVLWAGSTAAERTLRRTLTLPAVRWFVRQHQAFVSYGSASAAYLEELGAPPGKIIPGFHCVDNRRFIASLESPEVHARALQLRASLSLEKPVVLFVGRMLECKGGADLIAAARALPFVTLVMAGDGPERRRWERAAEGTGARFAGHVPLSELPAYYRLASVAVLPSHEEVWGLVLNEAALAALPLVASTACGASADLIEEGVNGYRVRPGDIAGLASAISRALDHSAVLGPASRRIVERYSAESYAASLARAAALAAD